MHLNARLAQVTERIQFRSKKSRSTYLKRVEAYACREPIRKSASCANLAHAIAAAPSQDKIFLRQVTPANIGIVSAYNDMLSAHQPFARFPNIIKKAANEVGAVAQFAGGVPAMCDGVTQGQPGMELSLFSRDVIALSTAIALSHNVFDAALCLGVCDKIIPGLLIGALSFGHLPVIFVPAGPMSSGLDNSEKNKTRQLFVEGKIGREELLDSELKSYHGPGTCTFYGTANSNQLLLEIMGLHLPGAAFIHPQTELRDALTAESAKQVVRISALGNDYRPIGKVIDERTIVNAIVGLLATGGSTNHTMHLVAIAQAAGIQINWDDFNDLSSFVPIITRMYPNGSADVNQFHACGGVGLVIRELLKAGLLHPDVMTVAGDQGLWSYCHEPYLNNKRISWRPSPEVSLDSKVISTVEQPFSPDGGLKLVTGNLGRAIVKVSCVKPEFRRIQAPAIVFDDQEQVLSAFKAGNLNRDFVAVVRNQGPQANGMPELHQLITPLGSLQDAGYRVAVITDGRMSGASGKVLSVIHVTPESNAGGALGLVRDGDLIEIDATQGTLDVLLSTEELCLRKPQVINIQQHHTGMGRELFSVFRTNASGAEHGASTVLPSSVCHIPGTESENVLELQNLDSQQQSPSFSNQKFAANQ